MITFFIPGEPKALKRHRSGKFGNYDPSKGDKADFLVMAKQERPKVPFDEPLSVTIRAYFQRPKSHYGTGKKAAIMKPTAPEFHTGTPDADNIGKFVCDALNGIFWRDDSCIAELCIVKRYVSPCGIGGYLGPGVDIEIDQLHDPDCEYFGIRSEEVK